MRDLLRTQHDSGRNAPRNFWNWVRRQPWRRMLPEPIECPGHCLGEYYYIQPVDHMMHVSCCCSNKICFKKNHAWMIDSSNSEGANCIGGQDHGGEIPYGIMAYFFAFGDVLWLSICWRWCIWIQLYIKKSGSHIDVRFASIYHYDQRLFRERFLGPPGVSWLWYVCNVQTVATVATVATVSYIYRHMIYVY